MRYICKNDDGYLGCAIIAENSGVMPYNGTLVTTEEQEKIFNFISAHPFSYYDENGNVKQDTEALAKSEKLKESQKEITELKEYLTDTDYVVSKLNELKLEDDGEYEKTKSEYAKVLAKRKEARKRINELESEISDSSSSTSSSDTMKSTI